MGKDITTNEFDIYTLPSPPKEVGNSEENLNSSSGTTASQKSHSGSPHKESIITSAITNESHQNHNHEQNNGSVHSSPVKKKHNHRNHNNNQVKFLISIIIPSPW